MGLLSLFRKNKQDPSPDRGEFYSRAEDESAPPRARAKRKNNQANEAHDPVLPEKKRARRRLVGAVALVLAAIIGLPMIFDSEPQPVSEDIAIQIPSKERALQDTARSAPPAPPTAALAKADAPEKKPDADKLEPAKVDPAPIDSSVVSTKENSKESATEPTKSAEPVKPVTAIVKAEVEPKTEPKAEPKATAKAAPAEAPKLDEAARAKAILEGRFEPQSVSTKTATADKSEQFVIQVAALSTKEKIDELRQKLKAAGLPSHTQKVATKSGEWTRIRVGPYATQKEVDSVRAKLTKLGLKGTVVPSTQ